MQRITISILLILSACASESGDDPIEPSDESSTGELGESSEASGDESSSGEPLPDGACLNRGDCEPVACECGEVSECFPQGDVGVCATADDCETLCGNAPGSQCETAADCCGFVSANDCEETCAGSSCFVPCAGFSITMICDEGTCKGTPNPGDYPDPIPLNEISGC